MAIDPLNRALAGAPQEILANLALVLALAPVKQKHQAQTALSRMRELAPNSVPTLDSLRENFAWLGPGFKHIHAGLSVAGLES